MMMNPFSYLALRYKNCSIHVKLFASYFLLIFIPIIAHTMFATYQSTKIIEKQSMEITGLYLQQTENELESELNRLATISSSVAQLSDVHEVLEKQDSNISFSEEYDDINALYKTIESTRTLYGVYQIRLYISDSFRYSRSHYITYPLSEISDADWYKRLLAEHGMRAFLPPSTFRQPLSKPQEVLSVVTLIRSRKDINTVLGAVRVDILKSDVLNMLRHGNYTEPSAAYLVDENLNIICGADSSLTLSDEELAADIHELQKETGSFSGVQTQGESVFGLSAPVFDGCRIFTVASMNNLLSPVKDLRNQMIVLTIISSVIAFILSYVYAKYSTRRIKTLAKQVQRVENGDMETVDIVVKLARFYRLSLSNGSDFLPLSDEAEHVRLFVELTNLSRGRTVELITKIDPSIADYPIMKLILQPIVENSLFHGLYELDDRAGVICLSAERIGSYVQIRIQDNGIGMDKGKLTEILAKKDKPVVNTKRGGYGIGNILERLHIYYDDDFMFEIDSAILVGTTVTIRVPYSRNDSPQIHAERPIGGAEQN